MILRLYGIVRCFCLAKLSLSFSVFPQAKRGGESFKSLCNVNIDLGWAAEGDLNIAVAVAEKSKSGIRSLLFGWPFYTRVQEHNGTLKLLKNVAWYSSTVLFKCTSKGEYDVHLHRHCSAFQCIKMQPRHGVMLQQEQGATFLVGGAKLEAKGDRAMNAWVAIVQKALSKFKVASQPGGNIFGANHDQWRVWPGESAEGRLERPEGAHTVSEPEVPYPCATGCRKTCIFDK